TVLAAAALAAPAARAQTTTANWLSGVSGSWDNPTLWTTNPYYPNNGNPAGSAYAAVVDAPAAAAYTVSLSRDVTVNSLLVNNANATVLVAAGGVLTGATVQAQNGTFQVAGGTLRNVTLVGTPTSNTPGRAQVTGTAALDNVTLQFLEVLSGQQV